MSDQYSIMLNGCIEINGNRQDIAFGMSGNVDNNNRVFDLAFDEAWVGRYFDADLFHQDFMAEIESTRIDHAYEAHRDREMNL